MEWLKGAPDQEQLASAIRNSTGLPIIKRLRAILQERIDVLDASRISDYDNPNWSHKRADADGQVRQLRALLQLLSFDER